MNLKCALLAGFILFTGSSAYAQTLFVDAVTGNDAVLKANNSAQTPWRTIGRAVWGSTDRAAQNPSEAVSAGQTVRVAGGTYITNTVTNDRYGVVYNPANSGSSSASPITIQCVGRCVLGAPVANGPVIGSAGRNYIKWYADVTQGHAWQIRSYGRQAGTAAQTEVNTTPDTGPVVCQGGTGCWIEGADIDGGLPTDYVDNYNGVRMDNCTSCVLRNNSIRSFRNLTNTVNGTAITIYGSANAIIENNFATDVATGVIFKDTAATLPQNNVRVRFNRLNSVGRCFEFSVQNENRNYIHQNVCSNSEFGLFITYGGLQNDWIFNNTFYNISSSLLYVSAQGVGGRFWNNVVVNASIVVLSEGSPMPPANVLSLEHNVYIGHQRFYQGMDGNRSFSEFTNLTGQERSAPASVEGNPMLVNPAGNDFRLCTGAGAPVRRVAPVPLPWAVPSTSLTSTVTAAPPTRFPQAPIAPTASSSVWGADRERPS